MCAERGGKWTIGRMASVIGHEVRNPLAVINNSIYFVKTKLQAGGDVDPKVAKHVGIIESEVRRANGIIGEILEFSRKPELNRTPQSLGRLAESALAAHPLPDSIKVEKELAPDGPAVSADADRITQAVVRLVRNAADAMPEGGTLRVRSGAASRTP